VKEYEEFIELTTDSSLKTLFEEMSITDFWCRITDEYQYLSKRVVQILLPFLTRDFCETGFLSYASTK